MTAGRGERWFELRREGIADHVYRRLREEERRQALDTLKSEEGSILRCAGGPLDGDMAEGGHEVVHTMAPTVDHVSSPDEPLEVRTSRYYRETIAIVEDVYVHESLLEQPVDARQFEHNDDVLDAVRLRAELQRLRRFCTEQIGIPPEYLLVGRLDAPRRRTV